MTYKIHFKRSNNKKCSNIIYFAILSCVIYGCASSEDFKESAMMLGGVSAMVATLPLVPVAMVYTIPDEYRDSKKRRYWKKILDPVYKERMKLIKARSAEEDAKIIFSDGFVFYLPSIPSDPSLGLPNRYPGLHNKIFNTSQNMNALAENELAAYLWELMKDDPSTKEASIYYSTTIRSNHNKAKFAYLEQFNQTMQQMESNLPTMNPHASRQQTLF